MRSVILALAISLAAVPAHAAELNGWALGAFTELTPADGQGPLDRRVGATLAFGATLVELGVSPLDEVAAVLGAPLRSMEMLSWTCLLFPAQGLRLIIAGDQGDPLVATFYGIEPLDAEADRTAGCVAAAEGEVLPLVSLPLPGATLKEVSAALGEVPPDALGRLIYNGAYEATSGGVELLQLRYRIDNGVAAALSVYRAEL